ncbi:protein RD3-like [Diretmus argenteus]
MFPWPAVFSLEPKVSGQRSPEELVTDTLMLELGAMVKRIECIRLERATEGRCRRRSSSSSADSSRVATAPSPPPPPYELTPNDLLELQDLCAMIPPPQCGPVVVRFRRMVRQMEPEVYEVLRLFRLVLCDCVEELSGGGDHVATVYEKHRRSKSLSSVTFRSKFCPGQFLNGPMGNLEWSDEEEVLKARARRGRSKSMPEMRDGGESTWRR